MKKVLYICEKRNKFLLLSQELKNQYTVYRAEDITTLENLLNTTQFRVVIVEMDDFSPKNLNSILLSKRSISKIPLLVVGRVAPISTIVCAMKQGASDYTYGISDMNEFKNKIEELDQYAEDEKKEDKTLPTMPQFIGESSFVKEAKQVLSLYAKNDFNLCLYGETGTGKGLLASLLHQLRYRGTRPFVSRNCGAIPETLFEAEAFGSEKGAFTGAVQRPGFFEQAGNGTLFLDEIGELPLTVQGKLLKVIEEKSVVRVGGVRERICPCALFTATHKDLKVEKEEGRFRADLYYRINTLTLKIPPLRERKEDIPLLVNSFLNKQPSKGKVSEEKIITDAAMNILMEHSWPGNIRELEMTLNRALVHSYNSRWIKSPHILLE